MFLSGNFMELFYVIIIVLVCCYGKVVIGGDG